MAYKQQKLSIQTSYNRSLYLQFDHECYSIKIDFDQNKKQSFAVPDFDMGTSNQKKNQD